MKTLANLKELYEKDFYQWITENLELLKNKEFDLVDWENLLEEIKDIGRRYLDIAVSFIAIVLEHFRESETMGNSWIDSIDNSRIELEWLFKEMPSLKRKAKEEIGLAWKSTIRRLVKWFENTENYHLAKNILTNYQQSKIFQKMSIYI